MNWPEVMPPMAIVMAHHAKNGPQDAPGGGRCRIIGRGYAPTLTLPRRGRGFITVVVMAMAMVMVTPMAMAV